MQHAYSAELFLASETPSSEEDGSERGPKVVYGRQALQLLFEEARTKFDAGEGTAELLNTFSTFAWMVPEEMQADIAVWQETGLEKRLAIYNQRNGNGEAASASSLEAADGAGHGPADLPLVAADVAAERAEGETGARSGGESDAEDEAKLCREDRAELIDGPISVEDLESAIAEAGDGEEQKNKEEDPATPQHTQANFDFAGRQPGWATLGKLGPAGKGRRNGTEGGERVEGADPTPGIAGGEPGCPNQDRRPDRHIFTRNPPSPR